MRTSCWHGKQSIPGVDRDAAETMIAEIGMDMSRFPSAAHLALWVGICPGGTMRVLASARLASSARGTGG
jgi:transposase